MPSFGLTDFLGMAGLGTPGDWISDQSAAISPELFG